MRKMLLLALGMVSFMAVAQQNRPVVQVKNGSYPLPLSNGTTNGYAALNNLPAVGGYRLGLVHFPTTPTDAARQDLMAQGWEFSGYLPKGNFLVRIPLQATPPTGAHFFPLLPQMKTSLRIADNNVPDYALVGNQMKVVIRFYPGVTPAYLQAEPNLKKVQWTALHLQEHYGEAVVHPDDLSRIAQAAVVLYIQEAEDPGEPENRRARSSHRVNQLQNPFVSSIPFDGTGVVVGLGDDGEIHDHIDYTGRKIISFAAPSLGDHGDHVAGTIFGAGNKDERGRGMAPGAQLVYHSYPGNLNNVDSDYSTYGVRITNSSYSNGCNAGYTNFTSTVDGDIVQNPKLMHVFSAGNNGTQNCNYGAGSGWGNITGGHKQGKNVIAVANLTFTDGLAASSSRGPATDGRIKPDVAAVGTDVFSTIEPNSYAEFTGTSMASPGTAGTLAALYHAFRHYNNGADPDGGLMKAILMNTTDDLGNAGPDFRYGYGRINARQALDVIANSQHLTDSITTGATKTFQLQVPQGLSELRIMVYWTDPSGSPIAQYALVNDINMSFTQTATSTTYLPWVLDPTPTASSLNATAVQAVDSLNNVEQVTLVNPASGDYTVTVTGANVPSGPQKFYVVYSYISQDIVLTYPQGGEGFVPGQQEVIRWENHGYTGTATLEFSSDSGATWTSMATVNVNQGYFNWNPPSSIQSGNMKIRISSNGITKETPGTFTLAAQPGNLHINWACPDSLEFAWGAVPGATAYEVSILGSAYMDSVATTTTTTYVHTNYNPGADLWWSVRAIIGSGKGRRAVAQLKSPGTFNCTLNRDIEVAQILKPAAGLLPSCQNIGGQGVKVMLRNNGIQPVANFPVYYRINGGTATMATFTDTLHPGTQVEFTLGSSLAVSPGTNALEVYAVASNDGNSYNDTLTINFAEYASTTASLPVIQNFDSFSTCGIATDCEATTCTLSNGWLNADNGLWDQIDWRTDNGGTASAGTGPSADHTLGNSSGNYLYLEASGPCIYKTALLHSPCIDLTSASLPEMSLWYHAFGADIGELHIDVLADGEWTLDAVNPIIGQQGNSWNKITLSLLPWVGKNIVIRINGSTGADFAGDLAIDDFSVYEVTTAPVAAFNANSSSGCVNSPFVFEDNSQNVPNAWQWTVTPANYTLLNGSTLTSQDLEVAFTAIGTYTISLVASNTFGADTLIQSNYVTIAPGDALPLYDNFNGSLGTNGWVVTNPDNGQDWRLTNGNVIGPDGSSTRALWLFNFNYNALGEEDWITSKAIELPAGSNPKLIFDVAYGYKGSGYDDELRIEVSDDCGYTFHPTGYSKSGLDLSTVGLFTTSFGPTSSSHWRQDTVDLSPWVGGSIMVRLVNTNAYGNNLYIENLNIINANALAATAGFTTPSDTICQNTNVVFTTTGSAANFNWDFGFGASPQTATGSGPHTVSYTTSGLKTVTQTAISPGGVATATQTLYAEPVPVANFNSSAVGLTVTFTDQSTFGPNLWQWDFGDGNSSTQQNPVHTYASGGQYTVSLSAINACGASPTLTRTLVISGISVEEETLQGWSMYPNPTTGQFTIERTMANGTVAISAFTTSGQRVATAKMEPGSKHVQLQAAQWPAGIYLIQITDDTGTHTHRLTVN